MSTLASLSPMWVTARAAGIAALLAASLAASVGLTAAIKPSFTRGKRIELNAAHEAISVATMSLIVLHGVSIFLDPWLKPGVTGVLVPFTIDYRPVAVALGQIAAVGMIGLGLAYYARARIGTQRWRKLHRFTSAFWVLAVAHGLLAGTDAGEWWFIAALGLPVIAAAALLAARWTDTRAHTAPGL